MSQAAADVKSTLDAKLIHENANLVLGTLPKSKIKIENLSKEAGIFKFNIDFSKLNTQDIFAFFDCLLPHTNEIQCLDLSLCNLFETYIIENIIQKLQSLSNSSKIQKFIISPNSMAHKPLTLSSKHQRLLLSEIQLNSDIIAGKLLNDFLTQDGDVERERLIPEAIMGLKFFSGKRALFLYPWQKPSIHGTATFNFSLSELSKIYADLKELITACFSLYGSLSIFTGTGLFAYCERELKQALEDQTRDPYARRVRFTLETLTWLGLILFSIKSDPTKYPPLGEQAGKELSNCIQDILNNSKMSTKIKMLQILQRNLIGNLTHLNPNGVNILRSTELFITVQHNNRFLENYLGTAKDRRKPIALLLCDLCRNSEAPEANSSILMKPEIVVFFNNALYREGVYNRIVIDVLLKLIESKEISHLNKVFLVLHCQKILKNKPEDKKSHYKIWSLLYSLLCSKLNKDIENFLNSPANIKDDMLTTLYWKFLQNVVGLSEADKKSYYENFNHENHHLILAFRQNLDDDDDDEKILALHFDKFIKAVTREGNAGFRKLRYDEIENSHLHSLFSIKQNSEFDLKSTTERSALKSLWSESDIKLTFTRNQFKSHQLICTDNYWDMMTWGFGINCLDPTNGEYKLLLLLLYGQHRLMILRDEKERVVAGCMLHLLLHNIHNPTPCLALGALYHRDRWQEQKEATEVKAMIRNLFERLGATVGLRLGIPCYAFYDRVQDPQNKISSNDCYPDRIKAGLGIFIKQGPIANLGYTAGLDGDFYSCGRLEHPQHGLCAIMYAYREISEVPLSKLEMSELETNLTDRLDNGPKHIISNILDYFSGGFRTEQALGNTLCFEWKSTKTVAHALGKPAMEPTNAVVSYTK
jgi:hypothetical protein